jgi:circadian clock protein KaiC
MKKRGSQHERTIREYRMDRGKIEVGAPLRQFRGILTGVPIYDTSHPVSNTTTNTPTTPDERQ